MNKTCIITGANSGIGKAAAIQIASKGYHVIIGSRSEERGNKALNEIKAASNSEDIEMLLINMASKESIKNAAKALNSKYASIDVLIHNAAHFDLTQKKPEQSPDGIETIWATNHIGPLLLTHLLLDKLKLSEQGRILTIASKGLMVFPNLIVDLNDPEYKQRKFSVGKAYYQSKLAQIMFTYDLAKKLENTNVTANCIRVTNVKLDKNRIPDLSKFAKYIYTLKSKSSIAPAKMAETYTLLATSPDLKSVTGKYFNGKNKIVSSSKYSLQTENIKAVMDLSMKYLNDAQ
ncbi:MAG: SDR family NAD(P)-dependent oxidoreductase [Bacteroidales bacterium]|nr:SDR family NAD(P)-dependent oxidoreductase [Bacteroidales bacterium]